MSLNFKENICFCALVINNTIHLHKKKKKSSTILVRVLNLGVSLWLQRIGMGHNFPWFLDSVLCIGVILHGTVISKPEYNYLVSFPGILGQELRLNSVYLFAGYYSFLSGLALVPYRVFYAMAAIGVLSFASKIIKEKYREKGEPRFGGRKHSHRHWCL